MVHGDLIGIVAVRNGGGGETIPFRAQHHGQPCLLAEDGVIALGNVFREELSDVLASPRAKAMVDGFRCRKAVEDLCRRCGYARKF